tara:strand:- start:52 stop:480 length:429 start_codon:yes stop_codon:yes gene_type:complete
MNPKLILVVTLILLTSCATPYQNKGFRGGVESLRVAEKVWEIDASGNAYTSESKIRDFVLLKAAEIGMDNGFEHFNIFYNEKGTDTDLFSTTNYYSGITTIGSYDKPKQSISVKFYEQGEQVPDTAYSVEMIYNQLSGKYID